MSGEPELAKQRLIQKITEAINDYLEEIEETKTITVKEIAVKLLDKNVPIADIADVTGMSTSDVITAKTN